MKIMAGLLTVLGVLFCCTLIGIPVGIKMLRSAAQMRIAVAAEQIAAARSGTAVPEDLPSISATAVGSSSSPGSGVAFFVVGAVIVLAGLFWVASHIPKDGPTPAGAEVTKSAPATRKKPARPSSSSSKTQPRQLSQQQP